MRLIYIALIIGIGLVFYLSWVPDSNIKHLWFIPNWLGRWADSEPNWELRTAIPFIFLGLFAGVMPARKRNLVHWLLLWLILIGIVSLAEVGQLFLANRYFEWADIGWGAAGALVGLVVAIPFVYLRRS